MVPSSAMADYISNKMAEIRSFHLYHAESSHAVLLSDAFKTLHELFSDEEDMVSLPAVLDPCTFETVIAVGCYTNHLTDMGFDVGSSTNHPY